MTYFKTPDQLYRSKEWINLMTVLKLKRVGQDGHLRCELCNKPITGMCIGHHIKHLTLGNLNDPEVSLNEDNIMLLHPRCHDEIHSRFGQGTKHTYLVYGPSSMKCYEFAKENASAGDTFCHVPSIREMVTFDEDRTSQRTNDLVYRIRDLVLDSIKLKSTKSQNFWIIGQFSYSGERERYARTYGAEEIFVDCTLEEAVALEGEKNRPYIEEWFNLNG